MTSSPPPTPATQSGSATSRSAGRRSATCAAQGDLRGRAGSLHQAKDIQTSSPPPTPATQSGSATSRSAGTSSATCARPKATSQGALEAYTEGQGTSATSSPPPTPATPSGSATSRSAGRSSATCGGPGRPAGRPRSLHQGQGHPRQARRRRPRQRRVAARLSVSWNRLGDVRWAQGELPGALQAYTSSAGRHHATSSPPPTPATPSGSATSASARASSAMSWQHRATSPGRSSLQRRQEHRQARRRRPRQRTVAARPLRQLGQARRRAAGPGRPHWRAGSLHAGQRHHRQARRRRPRQRTVAARPDRLALEARRSAGADARQRRRGRRPLVRALALARTLADTGRLAPPDAYFVEALEQRLAATPTAPGPPP